MTLVKAGQLCAKAKRQRQMFYLCESEASATKLPVGTGITPMSLLHLLNN
ncbi:hypothetical protein ACIQ57_01260 [Lysinibacillus xylanilyticus]